jgi:di/tricarboxylate transporter
LTSPRALRAAVDAAPRSKEWRAEIPVTAPAPHRGGHRRDLADAAVRRVALWQAATSRAPQPSKTFVALGVLLCVIVAASFGLVPAEVAASGGAVLMVLTGVITPRSAARALDPRVLGLLAGSIGLGAIVVESGLAAVIANAISDLSNGTLGLVIVLALATTVMTTL